LLHGTHKNLGGRRIGAQGTFSSRWR